MSAAKARNGTEEANDRTVEQLRQEFKQTEEKLRKEIEGVKDKGTDTIAKRVLRNMHHAMQLHEKLLQEITKTGTELKRRLKGVFTSLKLQEYGYPWDDHLDPIDNILIKIKTGTVEIAWGRKYLYRLREAVRSGDDEQVLNVAREALGLPDMPLPEKEKEDAVRGLNLEHPRSLARVMEANARERLKSVVEKYKLREMGFPWFEELSAVDNAILIVREISYRLVDRWCFLMELGFAVKEGDREQILKKASTMLELAPYIPVSQELYQEFCSIREMAREDYKELIGLKRGILADQGRFPFAANHRGQDTKDDQSVPPPDEGV